MANSVITEINATGYNGRFEYQGATGTWNASGDKSLQNIQGSKEGYGSFDANRWDGQSWQYNPHFSDPTKAADLIELMFGSISAIQAELGVD